MSTDVQKNQTSEVKEQRFKHLPEPLHKNVWKPGQSGNPAGRPKGARNKLQMDFFNALSSDFKAHGANAIVNARETDPVGYVKVVASLMPKEFEVTRAMDDISDEQLDAAIVAVRTVLAAQHTEPGEGLSGATQSAEALQAVSEAG
jgi:hypothetical protein